MVAPTELWETKMDIEQLETQAQHLEDHEIDLVTGGTVKEGLALLAVTAIFNPGMVTFVAMGVLLAMSEGAK